MMAAATTPQGDDDWLRAAIVQLKTGIPFFVKFLGKVTLPKSISEAPTDEDRAEVVLGCLRRVALSAGHVENAQITPVAEEFLADAIVVARNTDVQLTIYANAFILADVTTRRIIARHNTTEIAFAHVDPEFDDVIGYYCVDHKKGKPDTRCYYVIASDSAAQILASIKLAFVVLGEQTASGGTVNTQNIAELLTPSPSVPSTPSGYCLLRLSTPSDDGKGFVHTEKPVSTDTVQRTLRRMTPTSPGDGLQSILNTPSTPGSVTNVYLNVNVLQGVNPYTTNTIYPDVFAKYFKPRRPSPKFKEINQRRLSTVEEVQNQQALESAAAAPPLPPKKGALKGEPLKMDQISRQEPIESLITPEMDEPASSPGSYITYSRSIIDPPPIPSSMASIRQEATQNADTRAELYPEIKVEHDESNVELEQLHKELHRVREQIKKRNAALATRSGSPVASPQTSVKTKSKGPKRVMFQKLRKGFTDVGVPLKSKLGSLRTGAIKPKPAPPPNLQSPGSASECTSLNSSIFDGISLGSGSTRSASSADSGVQGDNELFVFPEAAHEAAHWTKRILKIEDPLPITATQFAQISEYLSFQPWFHGTVRRELAEARLVKDGEFLVRQSASQPGQFIVTALRRRTVHHIRVVSRDGQIRSHAGDFGSVVQLIQYHFTTKTPLCSKTAAIMLMTPVPRPAFWKHPKA